MVEGRESTCHRLEGCEFEQNSGSQWWTGRPGVLQSVGCKASDTTERLNWTTSVGDARDVGSILGFGVSPGEGNGNPLQYSCPENPMDRGAQWATVRGVATEQLSTHNGWQPKIILREVPFPFYLTHFSWHSQATFENCLSVFRNKQKHDWSKLLWWVLGGRLKRKGIYVSIQLRHVVEQQKGT